MENRKDMQNNIRGAKVQKKGFAQKVFLWYCFAIFLLLPAGSFPARAEENLASIFQDNMVLQREKPVPVWGWAKPGAPVKVNFGGQKKEAKTDNQGYWKTMLDPMVAGSEGRNLEVVIGNTVINRKNVLVGEVWIAAGQSNMVAAGPDAETGLYPRYSSSRTKGEKPEIRFTAFGSGISLEPLADAEEIKRDTSWQLLKDGNLPVLASLPLYFARELSDKLNVPVGIIIVAVAGTNQSAWMAKDTLESFPGNKNKSANFYQEFFSYSEERFSKSKGKAKSWKEFKEVETAWRETKKGLWPGTLDVLNFPTVLYNTRIHPLAPLSFRGVIWHQGEAGPGGPYGERLVAMIKQWRGLFGQEFDFIWGTLGRQTTQPPPLKPLRSWFYCSGTNVEIRKALKLFGEDKHVALVDFYDLGDEQVHWTQKAEGGRRLALAALTVTYGQKHLYTGPRMVEAKIEGKKALVRFEMAGDGLIYSPSIESISGFILKGKSGLMKWGQVKLTGKDTVEISHPEIPDLETVSYGESQNPHETLFSSSGFPASPFTVNPVTGPLFAGDAACSAPPQLLQQEKNLEVILNICHVRRSGYIFQPKLKDGKTAPHAPVTVQAYIPAEWKSFEVEIGGKRLEVKDTVKEGVRYVIFDAPMDGTWSIVAEAGKAAELRKINRF